MDVGSRSNRDLEFCGTRGVGFQRNLFAGILGPKPFVTHLELADVEDHVQAVRVARRAVRRRRRVLRMQLLQRRHRQRQRPRPSPPSPSPPPSLAAPLAAPPGGRWGRRLRAAGGDAPGGGGGEGAAGVAGEVEDDELGELPQALDLAQLGDAVVAWRLGCGRGDRGVNGQDNYRNYNKYSDHKVSDGPY
jgi:hypothetical protein